MLKCCVLAILWVVGCKGRLEYSKKATGGGNIFMGQSDALLAAVFKDIPFSIFILIGKLLLADF